jgi:hypothetical protein
MNPDKVPESPAVRKLRLLLRGTGEARGCAHALLTLLDARGLAISTADRAKIEACTDAALLDQWIRRAATAESVREVVGKVKPTRAASRRRPRRAAGF